MIGRKWGVLGLLLSSAGGIGCSAHSNEARREARDERRPPPGIAACPVKNLPAAVDALATEVDRVKDGPRGKMIPVVLEKLEGAVAALPGRFGCLTGRAGQIRALIWELDRSDGMRPSQASVVAQALSESWLGLAEGSRALGKEKEADPVLSAAAAAIDALRPEAPLGEQGERVGLALRHILETFRVSIGASPGSISSSRETASASSRPENFTEHVRESRALVGRLSQRWWMDAPRATSQLLREISQAIAALPGSSGAAEQVRLCAKRIEQSDGTSFNHSDWIKVGIERALDALESSKNVSSGDALDPWLRQGRNAVQRIDTENLLGLQRAVVQDAFRTLVDSYWVAATEQVKSPNP